MKYFSITYISQKTLHPEGYKTFTEFVAAETKQAAKLKALEVLSEKDPDCCMMYKVPRLDEISEDVYLSKTQQQLDIVDDMATQRYWALLALFGEQESYDEDEVRDADDLLACPDDEPEIYARYSALLQKVSEYRAVMPKDAHLDDIRQMALRAYQGGDIQGEDVHKYDRITMIANNNTELPHSHSKRNKVTHWPDPDKITVLALLESLLHAGKTSDSERTVLHRKAAW